jgi:hypothetical protein
VQYLDFEIDVTAGEGDSYTVKVRSPAGEATSSMRFPFDQLTLTNRLQALQIALLRSSSTRRRIASPESRTVQEFGQELWSALFSGDVLSRYEASRQEAKHQQAGIRIKFRCDDAELAALPWEYLFDPVRGDFVSLSTSTPLVRYIPLPSSMPPLVVTPPIRILAVAVSPSDLDGLDVERERSRLTQALSAIESKGLIELTWLPGQTWHDFQEALLEGPWHILHFIGHGGFDENRQEGIVAFARDDGRADYKRATSLGRLLGDHESLRLAVLNACESGRSDVTDLFSSTAGTLVRRGTPAVVAMQYEITDDAAIELSQSFYGAIARGIPVDTALTEARKGLATEFEDTLEWGTPVLFLEAPDGVLFNVAAGPVVAPPIVVPPPAPPPETPPTEPPKGEQPEPAPEPLLTPEPESPEPLPPPPPPPPYRRIAVLAGGGGAVLLTAALVANILGGAGTGGATPSPGGSGTVAATKSESAGPSGGAASMSTVTPSESASAKPSVLGIDDLFASGHGILFQHFDGAATDTNSDTSEIYLIDPETKETMNLTNKSVPDRWPRWSPEGSFFAFTRITGDDRSVIYTMDLTKTPTPLTDGSASDTNPDPAPNRFIYFNSNRNHAGDRSINIWRMAPRPGSNPTFVVGVRRRVDGSPAWSPDGRYMAYASETSSGGRAIYTMEPGGQPVRRTNGEFVDRNPTWDPDSRRLLFTRNAIGSDERDIWSLDIGTNADPTPVTNNSVDEGGPVYSPQGDRIAFFRMIGSNWQLFTADPDGGHEDQLTKNLVGNSIDPSWR